MYNVHNITVFDSVLLPKFKIAHLYHIFWLNWFFRGFWAIPEGLCWAFQIQIDNNWWMESLPLWILWHKGRFTAIFNLTFYQVSLAVIYPLMVLKNKESVLCYIQISNSKSCDNREILWASDSFCDLFSIVHISCRKYVDKSMVIIKYGKDNWSWNVNSLFFSSKEIVTGWGASCLVHVCSVKFSEHR